jgi:hypothetical protein
LRWSRYSILSIPRTSIYWFMVRRALLPTFADCPSRQAPPRRRPARRPAEKTSRSREPSDRRERAGRRPS